jgi:hypothetical protein
MTAKLVTNEGSHVPDDDELPILGARTGRGAPASA